MTPQLAIPKRILVCSDLHGFKEHFLRLLDEARYNPTYDRLYILGDVIDRGPYPIGTLLFCEHLVKTYGAVMLMGNHEYMFLDVIREHSKGRTLRNPGPAMEMLDTMGSARTYKEWSALTEHDRARLHDFLKGLPTIAEECIGGKHYIFVHAGLDVEAPLTAQSLDYILWVREQWILGPAYPGAVTIFGHTPTPEFKIWCGAGKVDVDAGCFLGERLAMLELPAMRECYVETCDTKYSQKLVE